MCVLTGTSVSSSFIFIYLMEGIVAVLRQRIAVILRSFNVSILSVRSHEVPRMCVYQFTIRDI